MKIENTEFLKRGISRYANARSTVAAFESQLMGLLRASLHDRKTWAPLKKHQIGRGGVGGEDDYGFWMCVMIKGLSSRGEKTVIDCGLWWDSHHASGPIIYADFYFKPSRVMGFSWPKEKRGIKSWKEGDGRTFLYLPLGDISDIAPSLNKLLDALLAQLK